VVKKATQRAAQVEDEAPGLEAARPGPNDGIEHEFKCEPEKPPFDPSEDFRGAVDAFADPVRPRTDHEALLSKTFHRAAATVVNNLSDIRIALTLKHARDATAEVLLSAVRVRKGMDGVRRLNETYHAHRNKSAKLVQVHADYSRHGTLGGLPGSNPHIADLESDHIGALRSTLIDSHVEGFHRLMDEMNHASDAVAEAIDKMRRDVDARNTARVGNMEDAQQALNDAVLIASRALDFHCAGGIKHVTVVQARASNDNKDAKSEKPGGKTDTPRKKPTALSVPSAVQADGRRAEARAAKASSRKKYSVI